MKLLREYIRELLREEPGRSYHTPNMDPMDVMEQEGFRVSSYIDINSGNSHVTIEQYNKKTDQWEEVAKVHLNLFEDVMPAFTLIEVSKLIDPDLLIEIEATAIKEDI